MKVRRNQFSAHLGLGLLFLLSWSIPARSQTVPSTPRNKGQEAAAFPWQTSARWSRGLFRKTSGVLALTDSGVTFRPTKGSPLHWSFEEIQTLGLSQRRLLVTGYQNRSWHFHGEREFRFDLGSAIPPTVATALARRVGKPSENSVPDPEAAVLATIPARHRTFGGGTNGTLRFRNGGIDYLTESSKGQRSWRWGDIQTLALPDSYHLRIGAYRETFTFLLKQPMSRKLYDRLWSEVYGHDLAGLNSGGTSQ